MLQPSSPIPINAKVHCLLDEDNCTWNEETVLAFFTDNVASEILLLPISRHGGNDFAYWPFTRYGEYSVRSAYNMARSTQFMAVRSKNGFGQCSDRTREERFWKAIWNVKAPNKMKVVLWRFAHDCLPSGTQLAGRHIPTSDLCCFCARPESVEHALLFCPYARNVWEMIKNVFGISLQRYNFLSPKLWLSDFLSRSSDQEATVLAVTFWHIWEVRNYARNNTDAPHPRCTVEKTKAYISMILQHLYQPVVPHRRETIISNLEWSPPPSGTIMLNSDAAVFSDLDRSGVGVVARDHVGRCVAACYEPIQGVLEPEMVEALALRRAVFLARDEQFSNVIFTTDCLPLVQRLNSSVQDRSLSGSVVADIKHVSGFFTSVVFKHIRRYLNETAHVLAKSC